MSEETNIPEMKVCKVCGRELPLTEFPPHPKSKDGRTATCKECHSKSMSEGQKAAKGKAPAEEKPRNKYDGFQKRGLAAYDDIELVTELRARGYDVECTKTIRL